MKKAFENKGTYNKSMDVRAKQRLSFGIVRQTLSCVDSVSPHVISIVKRVVERWQMHQYKVRADFNGLFGDVLCLSHEDTCLDETGAMLRLREGLILTAYDEDADEHGNKDDLVARGKVEPAPSWLRCNGSKWVLVIDENGVQHESDLRSTDSSEHA